MANWYSRAVFFVTDLETASDFYTGVLGFKEAWGYEEDGKKVVAQVTRGDCEIILATETERAGKGRIFIALEEDELEVLQMEIDARSIETTREWWGFPVIEIKDPDGNELLFPVEE